MAAVWSLFWVFVALYYEDVPPIRLSPAPPPDSENTTVISEKGVDQGPSPSTQPTQDMNPFHMSPAQWGVVVCMCWFAMTCFFILGAWESNLPVFGADTPVFHWSPFAAGNFIALGGITSFPFLVLNLFLARRAQDRQILAFGSFLGLAALLVFLSLLRSGKESYGSVFACWWAIALGFNLASTVTVSLLSKQLPDSWNGRTSLAIQYSNYTGRVTGAIWGGSGVRVGMLNYVGLEIAIVGIGAVLFSVLWRNLKTKTG